MCNTQNLNIDLKEVLCGLLWIKHCRLEAHQPQMSRCNKGITPIVSCQQLGIDGAGGTAPGPATAKTRLCVVAGYLLATTWATPFSSKLSNQAH